MPYQVIDVDSNEPYQGVGGTPPYESDTAAEANSVVRSLQLSRPGTKWRIKRVANTRWHQREQNKFDDLVYLYPPWCETSWWVHNMNIHRFHFAHISRSEPGKLAYTESDTKGMDNIQTQIKPGRYLEKYFGAIASKWDMDI